jgi:hypothetical protein
MLVDPTIRPYMGSRNPVAGTLGLSGNKVVARCLFVS